VVTSLLVIMALFIIAGSALGWWSLATSYLTGTAGGIQVNLVSFTATGEHGRAVLRWKTNVERNCQGFHLYRAVSGTNSFVQVNSSLIPGKPPAGGAYRFNDMTVTASTAYDYKLIAVGQQGQQVALKSVAVQIP